jgi:hypothetical protein
VTAITRFAPLTLFLLSACAHGNDFPYRWMGIHPSKGVLTGKTPKDDVPISVCEPDDAIKGKCVVMEALEFERLRADLIRLKYELKALEEHPRQ